MAVDYLLTFLSDDDVGVQYANTVCIHDSDPAGASSPDSRLDDVETWLKVKYANFLPSTITLRTLRLFRIPAVYGDDSEVASKDVNLVGALSVGTGTVPRETVLTLTLRSNHTSRRKMGRLFIPSPRNPSTLDGASRWVTSSSYVVNVKAFADALLAGHDLGVAGANGHLSTRVYSRQTHKEQSGDKTTDIDTYIVQPRPRWLRRRVTAP